MRIEEIKEISDAFLDAWEEFFGAKMFYVPFDYATEPHPIYKDSKRKSYLFENKKPFHGTLKEVESMDETRQTGKREKKQFILTFIQDELAEQGITHVDTNALIEFTDPYGKTFYFSIIDEYQKVQLTQYKLFTKLKVIIHA